MQIKPAMAEKSAQTTWPILTVVTTLTIVRGKIEQV
jgi:hypothetical protein